MSYLNQLSSGITYCEVISVQRMNQNYAIYVGADPSIITCEKTGASIGVYNTTNFDTPISDNNVISVVSSWYNRITTYNNLTIRELASNLISAAMLDSQKMLFHGLPKMTKVLASTLSSIKELMVIYQNGGVYEFLCFAYRKPLAEFLDQNNYQVFYFFPERFYNAALFETRFKNDFTMCAVSGYPGVVGIINKSEDKISLVMPVEWKTHSEFLEKNFMGE